ncbi:MAG: flagellar biosynthesis anti-sigma factor FlgM [Gammaproteobacteria bacterium]|nr:flagellar biosynthesis anti-sigma factor FlgM [Gammaproteobacteria bacterium]
MSGGIDGLGKVRQQTIADTSRSQGARRVNAEESNQNSALKADSIGLTDTLTNLKRLAEIMAAETPVDQSRVASLRDSISSGQYVVDGDRTAQNFMRLERELGGL